MNRFKSLCITTAVLSGLSAASQAQDVSDALRYSYLSPQGTARAMGFGNALGSVGGDFASLAVNPAGIGVYRSSEFTITPSVKVNSADGGYLGNSMSSNNARFNLNNLGIVFTSAKKGKRYEKSKWKSVSFGVGINRLADFNRDYAYSGTNYSSSATQAYAADAALNTDAQQPGTLGYLGYQGYLINQGTTAGQYTSIVDPSQGVKQMRTVSEQGGINELAFTLGGNYMEKLLLGATVGVPILDYHRDATYSERPAGTSDLINYDYYESLSTHGTGINLKLGAIYKFSDYFRIGAAVHSPTYYSMHDDYGTSLTSNLNSIGITSVEPTVSTYDYGMTTPWRGVLSATGFIGKYGFITADYEYVAYNTTRFHYDGDQLDENIVNQDIKNTLKPASNLRIGAEGRITKIFMVRLGFDYYGNPYSNTNGVNCNALAFSGGLGLRFDHWFIDAALVHTMYNSIEQPYANFSTAVVVPTATLNNSLNNAALTLGFKF